MQIVIVVMNALFLSTLSLRRATVSWFARVASGVNFYPRSPCGERPTNRRLIFFEQAISIHALLAESDLPGKN